MIIIDDFLCDDFALLIQEEVHKVNYQPMVGRKGVENLIASKGTYLTGPVFGFFTRKVGNISSIIVEDVESVYTNLGPTGENHAGVFHEDGGDITALYYPYKWDMKYGGGTEFEDDGTIIDYVQNRLILFNAKRPHRAMAHSNADNFRYTLAVKMKATWAMGLNFT